MKTTTDIYTGGVVGTLRTIQKELKRYNYFPVVVFDGGLSPRRLKLYPEYKANQHKQILNEGLEYKTEQELKTELKLREYKLQRNILVELLPLLRYTHH